LAPNQIARLRNRSLTTIFLTRFGKRDLEVEFRRVACRGCGLVKQEKLAWIADFKFSPACYLRSRNGCLRQEAFKNDATVAGAPWGQTLVEGSSAPLPPPSHGWGQVGSLFLLLYGSFIRYFTPVYPDAIQA
jgi:hypothetical protein